ncbi:MAG: UvrD-helicase domain-containing protein [Actinomycetia bacterium]|nr:UvrD-helicase domain-containing protein [Actinomycetes bacterium]
MTLQKPLADADARHTVTRELDRTLFVEAGAGSGKTTSLVRRIVNLVASGVPISQIAAITFTEAAAAELRHRIRDELESEGLERADQVLVGAAGQVESAPITTLHGFALRLLTDHPVEAGLPPGFGVVDEITSMLAFDESWRLFTGQIGDDLDLLDLQERAALLGVELRRFVDIARRFDANWDLLESVERQPAPLSPLDLGTVVGTIVALGGLADHCLDPGDRLAEELIRLSAEAEGRVDHDPLQQLEWVTSLKLPGRIGRKGNWVRMDVDEARHQVQEVKAAVAEVVNSYQVEVMNHIVARIATYVDGQVSQRREKGELAFHDLLVLARQLLRSHPQVREQLHQRYRYLLLDEFQDTDPIQIELAVLLAADGEVGARPWPELAVELGGGRVVVVGDPKQSIYRFRRADIGVYAEAEASLVTEPTHLVSNFRSVPAVVDFVNQFFAHVIGGGQPGAQPAYTNLVAVRESEPGVGVGVKTAGSPLGLADGGSRSPVVVLGGPHEKSVPVSEIRELEAADVASLICRAMDEEWRTEREGQWLPLRLQDIAVLIPSRLSLPALETAFSAANLPFRPETSSLVYATQEVRDVMAGVRAVVDPSSSVDVVAALRSGLFAVGDDQLLAWHQAGGSWDYTTIDLRESPAQLAAPLVAETFAALATWHQERWWMDPSALIERIVVERRLREAALAEPRPRDRWRRYRFLAEQARQFTATMGGDLHDFVAWVEIQSSDLARVTEPVPAEPDDDAVRVLTIHGSKGLEFPMVVLAGAPTQERNRAGGAQVLFPEHGAPEVSLSKGKATEFYDVHASVEEVLDGFERVRLHYVGATRARDVLVMSAHHKEGNIQSAGRRTWEALEHCAGWRPFERSGDERYQVEPPTQLRLTPAAYGETEAVWQAEQERLLQRNTDVRTFSATTVSDLIGTARPLLTGDSTSTPTSTPTEWSSSSPSAGREAAATWRAGGGGAAVGSAVHAVLQHLDLAQPVGVDELVARHAEREGVAELTGIVGELVAATLEAPTLALAKTRRHWRELYVAAPLGDRLIEGFIDLCIEGPEGLIVVDYKTDLVPTTEAVEAKLQRYQYQAGTYALGLEAVTGRVPADCRFLFVGQDGVVERSVPDLAMVMETIRAELAPGSRFEMTNDDHRGRRPTSRWS